MKLRKPRIKFKPALFLCLVSASLMMYLILDVPISYPIPQNCQAFAMNLPPLRNNINSSTGKTWVPNYLAARKIRKLSSNCLPMHSTLMIYAANNTVNDIDFKQGFNPIEYITFLFDGKTGTPPEMPAKFDRIQRQKQCAIIGNSGVLLNSNCGKEINSHDFVMRSNFAPVEQYMADVGVKTNLTVINIEKIWEISRLLSAGDLKDPLTNTMLRRLKFLNDSMVWYPKGARFRFYVRTKLQFIAKQLKTKYHLPLRIGYSWRNLEALIKWFWSMQEYYTTTGLNMYTVATTFCDQITLYGFYPFHVDKHGRRIPHHYYEDIPYDYDNKVHSFHEEFDRLKILHGIGALRLVTNRCYGEKPSTISLPKK